MGAPVGSRNVVNYTYPTMYRTVEWRPRLSAGRKRAAHLAPAGDTPRDTRVVVTHRATATVALSYTVALTRQGRAERSKMLADEYGRDYLVSVA